MAGAEAEAATVEAAAAAAAAVAAASMVVFVRRRRRKRSGLVSAVVTHMSTACLKVASAEYKCIGWEGVAS